ncbi:MAG: DUF1275 domain-containing protein [Planctomycetes bacterium]|nr:DUF1275 domain-containing protein [Planctomycetota bacterium]
MSIGYARGLAGIDRTDRSNRHLGWTLAFIAGATNAGAFLAVKQYTSHMTGVVSAMADNLVLGDYRLVLNALGALLSFLLGAMTTAILVNFAKRRHLKSQFALPLLLEAALLLLFGVIGAQLHGVQGLIVPGTVALLCFIMGLQNAVITKVSNSVIRTTHVTGLITDMGIELGKLVYWNRTVADPALRVVADRDRLLVLSLLVVAFFVGGIVGALGFERLGYAMTVPLAFVLVIVAAVPAVDDIKDYWARSSA